MSDDTGMCGRSLGRQQTGGFKIGKRNIRPEHNNIAALAKLFGTAAEEMLKEIKK